MNDVYRDAVDSTGCANVVWLASYPKSGNTWIRSVLAAYRLHDPAAFAFTDLLPAANIVNRQWLSNHLGVPTTYLQADEVLPLLPTLLHEHARSLTEVQFIKTHLNFEPIPGDPSVFDGPYSRRAIFIVRNPLSIAASLAHHMRLDIDGAIAAMNNAEYGLAAELVRVTTQMPQRIGDWNSYTLAWLDQTLVPVTVVRYEDLRAQPLATMSRVLEDCSVRVDVGRLDAALAATRFEALQTKESESGFRESMQDRPFFRRGETDAWRDELTDEQVERILTNHGSVMRRLGYATENLP